MEGPRPEKVAVVEEVRQRLGAAGAAILTDYRGLSVSEMAALRRQLREAGADYKVYKNTLVRLAVRGSELSGLEPMLEGPTAIAFVEGDASGVARALRDYARSHPALAIKGGVLARGVLSASDATALADLPTRQELLAQLAGALAAPMQRLAQLLQALPQGLAFGLRALIDRGGPPASQAGAGGGPPGGGQGPSPGEATPPEGGAEEPPG
jgi:large subunit ribosomal protein L10